MLHITNGDAAAEKIRAVRPGEPVVPWRDVLHEGPVPDALTLAELSAIRTAFIAARGWASLDAVRAAFEERDEQIAGASAHDEIVLWFDDDLYDQLQLIQVLTFLGERQFAGVRLSLVELMDVPSEHLFSGRRRVGTAQVEAATQAWHIFRAPDPSGLSELAARPSSELPFLADAVRRFLEEYPSADRGLGRTELQVLRAIDGGARDHTGIFLASQAEEDRPFMGDTTLWSRVDDLTAGNQPLLSLDRDSPSDPVYRLTGAGKAVLAGDADALALNGIDRWFGGVHLNGSGPRWRWEGARLIPG